jgi:hypothetical protein
VRIPRAGAFGTWLAIAVGACSLVVPYEPLPETNGGAGRGAGASGPGGSGGLGDGGGGEGGGGMLAGGAGSCPELPCKLVLPQCGCAEGLACTLVGTARKCAVAGSKLDGEACNGDCVAGHVCHAAMLGFTEPLVCHRACVSDADCEAPGGRCLLNVANVAKGCTHDCNAVSGEGCPASATKCEVLMPSDGSSTLTACVPHGTLGAFKACRSTLDCGPGLSCFNANGSLICLRWCRVGTAGDCTAGYSCHPLPKPAKIGAVEYGVCYP